MTPETPFFPDAVVATLWLIFKAYLALRVGRLFRLRWPAGQAEGFIAGWIIVHMAQAAILLALSTAELLQRHYMLALAALLGLAILRFSRSAPRAPMPALTGENRWLPLVAIAGVSLAMWVRSLFFYDHTWDAQTYGLPRLALWMNAGTVFLHMPTPQLNLFVNEWNAELNSLAYALAAGSPIGFAFGNLEVLLVLFITVAWVARMLGAPIWWALTLSVLLCSAPAILGLASTVKGDLLACLGLLMAFGWLVRTARDGRTAPWGLALFVLSLMLAVGAKLSVLIPAAALTLVAAGFIFRAGFTRIWPMPRMVLATLILGALIFLSRFWTNWLVYGNPLQRVDVEHPSFSVANLISNLQLSGDKLFGFGSELLGDSAMWALAGSMGASAALIVLVGAVTLMRRLLRCTASRSGSSQADAAQQNEQASKPSWTGQRWAELGAAAILAGTLASMTLSQAYPWSFRYFLPGALVLLLLLGARLRPGTSARRRSGLALLTLLAIGVNVALTLRPGEVLPTPHVGALRAAIGEMKTPLERMTFATKGPYEAASVEALALDAADPLQILVYQALDAPLLLFLGSHAQNRIRTVANADELLAQAPRNQWDVVAVSQRAELRDPKIAPALEKSGYRVLVDNWLYVIALPESRLRVTHVHGLAQLQWQPWNAPPGARLGVTDGVPTVESAQPADTALVSQPVSLPSRGFLRARFDGEISGSGTHAAHLSVHGERPLIQLPAGHYSSEKEFVATFNGGAPHAISFGLGGWAQGSGQLRLAGLEIFGLEIGPPSGASATDMAPPRTANLPDALAPWLAIIVVLACALMGRSLLTMLGIPHVSFFGSGMVVGYGVLGLLLLLSLRWIGSIYVGALLFAALLVAMIWARRRLGANVASTQAATGTTSGPGGLSIWMWLILVSWIAAVVLTYLPLTHLATAANYQFPDIFDLPKHLFASFALSRADAWPPPNPFFAGEAFAYNFLFYQFPALISKLVGSSLAVFQTFPVAVLATAVALPLTLLDVARRLTPVRSVHLLVLFLATWGGGLTPLLVDANPKIGFQLYAQGHLTSQTWTDELFQSVIYVPQHVFAVLCAVIAMSLLMSITQLKQSHGRLFLASTLIFSGVVTSLVLLPQLLLAHALALAIIIARHWRQLSGPSTALREILGLFASATLPMAALIPFVLEALGWSGGTGTLLALPVLSSQWLYVLAALGLVVPLAVLGLLGSFRRFNRRELDATQHRQLAGFVVLALIGALGMLFGAYPDAGIKSGLWLRIVLVPIAGAGLLVVLRHFALTSRSTAATASLLVTCAAILALNFPTTLYFAKSAWRPLDGGLSAFVEAVRALPETARIVLFVSEQNLVSMIGRPVDFDFSPLRSDSYMPPEGRDRAQQFWSGVTQGAAPQLSAIDERYDYAIAPAGSPIEARLADRYGAATRIANYAIFHVAKTES